MGFVVYSAQVGLANRLEINARDN